MAIIRLSRQDAASDNTPQPSTPTTPAKKQKATHTKRRPYDPANLLKPGRLKTGEMLGLYKVSHSTFYQHRAKGIVPPPDGHIMGRPFWLTSTVAPHFVGTQATQAKG
ncbi:MAG: hypothetical protein I8H67_11025 [Comamonadaceae bacterium]|nr:hypothetical protein [Comamonadaceae bacterium]